MALSVIVFITIEESWAIFVKTPVSLNVFDVTSAMRMAELSFSSGLICLEDSLKHSTPVISVTIIQKGITKWKR